MFAARYFIDQFVTDYLAEHMTSASQADVLACVQLSLGDTTRVGRSAFANV